MKKTASTVRKIKKDIKNKLKIKRSPFYFWNYVNTANQAQSLHRVYLNEPVRMKPHISLSSSSTQSIKEKFSDYLMQTRRSAIDKIKTGSLIACVFTSKHQQWFPPYKKTNEIKHSKIRTFFGHFVQQRNRGKFSSILIRTFIAGEFFLLRIFIYAPNVISFFSVFNFKGNNRSCFLFKVRKAKKYNKLSHKQS